MRLRFDGTQVQRRLTTMGRHVGTAALLALSSVVAGCGDDDGGPSGPADAGARDMTSPDGGAPPTDLVERACVGLAACPVELLGDNTLEVSYSVVECIRDVDFVAQHIPDELSQKMTRLACVAAAGTDCEAVAACYGVTEREASCDGATPGCDGDVAGDCSGKGLSSVTMDCGVIGQVCVAEEGFGRCAEARCEPPDATSYCDGNTAVHCDSDGAARLEPCPTDLPCEVGSLGDLPYAECSGAGPCEQSCDGDFLLGCQGGPFFDLPLREDCRAYGQRCMVVDSAADCVTPDPDPECDGEDSAQCAGDVLQLCIRRKLRQIDCRSMGWAGCSLNELDEAVCVAE